MKWQLVVLFPREFCRLRDWRSRLLQKVVYRPRGSLNANSEPDQLLISAERNWESEV
jgi:hypothetical protein